MIKIRNNYREGENRGRYSSNIVSIFNDFVVDKLQLIASFRMADALTRIIAYSVQTKNYSIFMKSSSLLQLLTHLPVHFLSMIKSCTPI